MRKGWREKPLHGKYALRTDSANVDRVAISGSAVHV